MNAPRLNLPGAVARDVGDIRVQQIQRFAQGGRWKTEAMRSYSQPVLMWFTRGQGRITIAGVTRGYGAHNAIFIPAGTMHGFCMAGQVFGSVLFLSDSPALDWPAHPLHLRLREAGLQGELTGLIDALERELSGAAPGSQKAVFHRAGLLSVFLERHADHADAASVQWTATAANRLSAAFSALVERDFRTPKSVADYAAELGVTPAHLTRACKEASGRNALEIVGDRKLFEARERLLSDNSPVQTIAEDLGFGSAAYFTRAFRNGTGKSPTEFRNTT